MLAPPPRMSALRTPALPALWRTALCSTVAMLTAACGSGSADATAPSPPPGPPPPVSAVRSIRLVPDREYLLVGQLAALRAVSDVGESAAVTWTSDVSAVATVSGTGEVTAVAPGLATVTARSTAVPSVTGTMTVEVRAPSLVGQGFGLEQFTLIPAGSFQMGSIVGADDERPVRTVTISQPFRMQRTEVTQAQWRQVMQGTGLENPGALYSCVSATCPVSQVNWNDIQQFLTRLNQQDPGKNYRLPTEAEWEYAARAGVTGGGYAGNGVLNDMAWWNGNAGQRTRPVAWKLANAFELFDTHGNVSELVSDWYSATYYSTASNVDPPGPSSGMYRVLRGGSAFGFAEDVGIAVRSATDPSSRESVSGFRLARIP